MKENVSTSIPLHGEIHFNHPTLLDPSPALCMETAPPSAQLLTPKRVLVMGSGSGSNFEALVHALRPWGIQFVGLFCDRYGTKITERAKRLDIPITQPPPRSKKGPLNEAVTAFLQQPFDLLVLAGYMRILHEHIVAPYEGKIVNIHPSLLPDFPGLNAIQQAVDAGAHITGITVHLVNEKVDDGEILSQARLPILSGEPIEDLEARVHALEHKLYPQTVLRYLART